MLLKVYYREAIQSQSLPPTLYVNLIATYISGVRIKRAYIIDDLYHTTRIDPTGMVKIVYIVCTCICKLNNNIIIANCNNSKLQLGGFL